MKKKKVIEYKFTPTERTRRVIKVIQALKLLRSARTNVEIAKVCKFSQPSLTTILKGKRNAPASLILALISKYNVDENYINKGKEPMFKKNMVPVAKTRVHPHSIKAICNRFEEAIYDIAQRKLKGCETAKDVCKIIKMNSSHLSQIKGNNTYFPPTKYIYALGVHFDISSDWILFNEANMYRQENTASVFNLTREVSKIKTMLQD